MLLFLLFEAVAVTLWLTKDNFFYLLNFSYIGACLGLGTALVSNHQFNWWFIISPPKGYCYCSPQRAVSQALLLARYKAVLLESSRLDSSACSFIYF